MASKANTPQSPEPESEWTWNKAFPYIANPQSNSENSGHVDDGLSASLRDLLATTLGNGTAKRSDRGRRTMSAALCVAAVAMDRPDHISGWAYDAIMRLLNPSDARMCDQARAVLLSAAWTSHIATHPAVTQSNVICMAFACRVLHVATYLLRQFSATIGNNDVDSEVGVGVSEFATLASDAGCGQDATTPRDAAFANLVSIPTQVAATITRQTIPELERCFMYTMGAFSRGAHGLASRVRACMQTVTCIDPAGSNGRIGLSMCRVLESVVTCQCHSNREVKRLRAAVLEPPYKWGTAILNTDTLCIIGMSLAQDANGAELAPMYVASSEQMRGRMCSIGLLRRLMQGVPNIPLPEWFAAIGIHLQSLGERAREAIEQHGGMLVQRIMSALAVPIAADIPEIQPFRIEMLAILSRKTRIFPGVAAAALHINSSTIPLNADGTVPVDLPLMNYIEVINPSEWDQHMSSLLNQVCECVRIFCQFQSGADALLSAGLLPIAGRVSRACGTVNVPWALVQAMQSAYAHAPMRFVAEYTGRPLASDTLARSFSVPREEHLVNMRLMLEAIAVLAHAVADTQLSERIYEAIALLAAVGAHEFAWPIDRTMRHRG